jgi:hypothetical protein
MDGKIRQIWEALAACFASNDQPLTRNQVLAWISSNYPSSDFNPATVQAQLYRSCVNVPFAQAYKSPKIIFYNSKGRTYIRAEAGAELPANSSADEPEDVLRATESASILESHLQSYLAKNLSMLEEGLVLWSQNPPSVEYYIEGRRIDVLARDSSDLPVVIELKRNGAYDQVIGQALLYRAMVAAKFNLPRVRIILVANEITTELKLASSGIADVDLFEYAIAMKVIKVSSKVSQEEVQDGSPS